MAGYIFRQLPPGHARHVPGDLRGSLGPEPRHFRGVPPVRILGPGKGRLGLLLHGIQFFRCLIKGCRRRVQLRGVAVRQQRRSITERRCRILDRSIRIRSGLLAQLFNARQIRFYQFTRRLSQMHRQVRRQLTLGLRRQQPRPPSCSNGLVPGCGRRLNHVRLLSLRRGFSGLHSSLGCFIKLIGCPFQGFTRTRRRNHLSQQAISLFQRRLRRLKFFICRNHSRCRVAPGLSESFAPEILNALDQFHHALGVGHAFS